MSGVILNIRPDAYRERFHGAFSALGLRIVDSPVLSPEPLLTKLPDPAEFDSVIFTSQVPVAFLRDTKGWQVKRVYAVGAATAEAARRAGFATVIQTGMDSKDLARALSLDGFRRAFYPSAEDVSTDIALDDPVRIRRLAVYRMAPQSSLSPTARSLAGSEDLVLVPLFSRRSARTAEDLLAKAKFDTGAARLAAVGISADVFGPDPGPWQRRAVADKPTLESVVDATRKLAADMNSEVSR